MPPAGAARSRPSVRIIRRSLERLAPRESRIATSFRRAAAFANKSEATFALAIATSKISDPIKSVIRRLFLERWPGSSK
jgi:hypothetical protein